MGNLVVNGNSVYEVDENCMKKKKCKKQVVSAEDQRRDRTAENRRPNEKKAK